MLSRHEGGDCELAPGASALEGTLRTLLSPRGRVWGLELEVWGYQKQDESAIWGQEEIPGTLRAGNKRNPVAAAQISASIP